VVSPFGGHWFIFAGALAVCFSSGGLFIGRWTKRGVFRSLRSGPADQVAAVGAENGLETVNG
jgi:hypothetical protein